MKDDNYELELGVLSGGGHGLPHFYKDPLLLRVGVSPPCSDSLLVALLLSRPSNLRPVVLTSRVVGRVGVCDCGGAWRRPAPVIEPVRGEAGTARHFYVSCMQT